MTDLRDLLEREAHRVGASSDAFTGMEERARRRRVRRRVGTGALAITLAAVGSLAAFQTLRPGSREILPAGPPATMTAEIAGVTIDYPSDWTLLDVRREESDVNEEIPFAKSILEIVNVNGQSCLNADAPALPPTAVVLQVGEFVSGRLPPAEQWPVSLERPGPASGVGCGGVEFTDYQAGWRAAGRRFDAVMLVGPEAPQRDVDTAISAFRSLRFEGDHGPFVESSDFPRQVVGSGEGWLAYAFEERTQGTLCMQATGDTLSVPATCFLGPTDWESGVQPPTEVPFGDGVILFGGAERGIRSITVNAMAARIVRPLARFDVGFDLYAVFLPEDKLLGMTVVHADGRQTHLGEAAPAESPAPPVQTPEPISPEAVSARSFVGEFAAARVAGAPEEDLAEYLSEDAFEAYRKQRGTLSFYEEPGVGPYVGWRIESSRQVPGETEITLGMEVERGGCVETYYETVWVRLNGEPLIVAAAHDGVISIEDCP